LLDIVKQPLQNFNLRIPEFPKEHLIQNDFFNLSGQYDLILEQTFFCALDPSLRTKYVEKMYELLTKNGKLVGLLFDFPLVAEGPPFGGSIDEYRNIFSKFFKIKILEKSYNSIPDRNGKELFVKFEKK
jgi:thiopurine S-methyltransferase